MTTQQNAISPVTYGSLQIDGLNIAYREAGEPANPKLVLLHGFPASSHQYRNLIPALAGRFHVIAPDYPGFGNSDKPDPAKFAYTFENLTNTTEKFLQAKGFTKFGLFMQDYGGPVGFRILTRHPEWAQWLILQNTNAYEVGFTAAWDAIRHALWTNRSAETEAPLLGLLSLDGIKSVYLAGHRRPELISPDNWNMDFQPLQHPHGNRIQLDLFYDYRTNVELYASWQQFLRNRQPRTIIFWGQHDIFFSREGGEAYLRDLPDAEMHRLDSGHFAVEDSLDAIASNIIRFHDEKVGGASQAASRSASR
jgi:pimeloyl-ACP methyl ester carboxylesterase